jgi:hypothetical protein
MERVQVQLNHYWSRQYTDVNNLQALAALTSGGGISDTHWI